MQVHRMIYFFYLLLVLGFFVLGATFQTSFWYQIFGWTSGPMIWVIISTYIAVYRPHREGILLSYACGTFLYFMGWSPWGLIILNLLSLTAIMWLIKGRIFLSGLGYFVVLSFIGCAWQHMGTILLSLSFEKIPIHGLDLLSRVSSLILTPLFSPIVYYILRATERKLGQVTLSETGEA